MVYKNTVKRHRRKDAPMKEIPITSFDNIQIGQAENTAAGTGCTVVLLGKDGAPAGLDVRGGGPASR